MEVCYCPQVFVCYPELRRRDRAGFWGDCSPGANAAKVSHRIGVDRAQFPQIVEIMWEMCVRTRLSMFFPGHLNEAEAARWRQRR
jgi:hypothetical protein